MLLQGEGTRCFAGGRKNAMLDSFLNCRGGGGRRGSIPVLLSKSTSL